MRILYIGDDWIFSTSSHRASALRRIGHDVLVVNPSQFIPAFHRMALLPAFHVRTGYRFIAPLVASRLRTRLSDEKWDLVWIDAGAELSPASYHWLRHMGKPIINYVTDNPFRKRDYRKWDLYLKGLPFHDMTVVPREENVAEAYGRGAKKVLRVGFSYDPIAHAPSQMNAASNKKHEVIFVGSWMPERGSLIKRLLQLGLPVKILGDGWPDSPEWSNLKPHWLGVSVYGASYVEAIESSRIAIGLLSKGNRDLHTTRSVEIPFIGGGVFCAERTAEHSQMYREGIEAAFWDSPEECTEICLKLLGDPDRCLRMAAAARARVINLKLSNDEVLKGILEKVPG